VRRRHAGAVREIRRSRRSDPLSVGETGEHLDLAGAADADRDLAFAHLRAVEHEHRVALHGVRRDQQRVRLFARDDIGFHAHARFERRVVGQRDLDAKGLGGDVAHGRDLAHLALQPPVGERVGAEQRGLPDRDARDVFLVHLGHHLQRFGHADAVEDLPDFGDFTDLAVAAQHHAVHRRHDDVVVDLLKLHGDLRLYLPEIHRGAFVVLRGGRAAGDQFAYPRHFALEEGLARLEILQLRLDFAVVEPRQHVTLGNRLALAVAEIDDAVAHQARHFGPAHRLDAAGGIDDLDRGAARRRDGGHLGPAPEIPPARRSQQQRDRYGNQQISSFHKG